jgi:chromosome segregation ATPase
MSTFDYPYTCPDINKNIEYIQGSIENFLQYLIDDYKDNGFNEDISVKQLSKDLYSDIEQYIEEIRSSNQSIRDAAEKQIQKIEDEKFDLEMDLQDKNKEIDDLNDKIYDLEKELAAFE